jgi:hypothetical protein
MHSSELAGDYESRMEQDLSHVTSALRGLRYGSVEIIIHDSRIVQIERTEKIRLER